MACRPFAKLSRVEAKIEYLDRSPGSRMRWRKWNPVPGGGYLGHPVFGGYKYLDLALQVGEVSRIGTIKYGLKSLETQTRAGLRWRGPAATVITDPSSRQRGRYKTTNPQLSKENNKEKVKLVAGSRWVPETKPTDCRV
jgi:hypothetical protein